MLSPDDRARVEQTAMAQLKPHSESQAWKQPPDVERDIQRLVALSYMPTLAPWFQTAQGRPIWLTPADRAFLKGHRISDR